MLAAQPEAIPARCTTGFTCGNRPKTPERAEEEADRLLPLMPGAGHIVHMPAHIYLRVGRYADVVKANQQAVAADEDYIAQCRAQGHLSARLLPAQHPLHLDGRDDVAARARWPSSRRARWRRRFPPRRSTAVPPLQGFLVVPYCAMVRFGKWDEILAEPAPRHETIFTRGVWHYARGRWRSRARAGWRRPSRSSRRSRRSSRDPALQRYRRLSPNTPDAILRIAPEVLAGEIAAQRKDFDTALLHLDRAVRLEDALIYTEPPDWHAPVRQNLGAVACSPPAAPTKPRPSTGTT